MSHTLRLFAVLAVFACLQACSTSPRSSAPVEITEAARASEETPTALNEDHQPPATDAEKLAEAERRLAMMEQAMQADTSSAGAAQPFAATPPPVEGAAHTGSWQPVTIDQPESAGAIETGAASTQPTTISTIAASAEPAPVDPETLRRRLVDQLSASLRNDASNLGFYFPAWLRIAALETIEPGALNAHFFGGDAVTDLTEAEHEFLTAWRDLHVAMYEHADTADVQALASIMREHADQIDGLQPLSIEDARLCTRVERYGVFDERDRPTDDSPYKLLAGRPQRLLVYLELDHYAHRADNEDGADGYSVDLTFALSLHHLGRDTDLLAWRMAEEEVSVFSRNKRREFFVSILADLPPTISIDSYNLKARVTDENSGQTVETILRLDMVGDESALTSAVD